ncbi:hypothetical protein J4Q44_G00073380 [Coregonus suidteri]|uniref:DUF4806 domain-containing protein n=1 Tax=Coregonus suidteri TaxID=861788 RepID=A0AAN8N827_9TELE
MEHIDVELKASREFRQKMIDYLGLKGGCDVKESVWRIMAHIISHDLSKTMNWRGINGKVPFCQLQLKEIVNAAVRRNRLTSDATDKEVEKASKDGSICQGIEMVVARKEDPLGGVLMITTRG